MSNSIHVISPYRHNGMWVFTDPAVGLKREPFVAGADTVIDMATQSIPGAGRGFNLVFSANPFPGAQIVLEKRGEGDRITGNNYQCVEFGVGAWLCPALYKYFDVAPECIYAEFKAKVKTNESKIKNKQEVSKDQIKQGGSVRGGVAVG